MIVVCDEIAVILEKPFEWRKFWKGPQFIDPVLFRLLPADVSWEKWKEWRDMVYSRKKLEIQTLQKIAIETKSGQFPKLRCYISLSQNKPNYEEYWKELLLPYNGKTLYFRVMYSFYDTETKSEYNFFIREKFLLWSMPRELQKQQRSM